MKELPEMLRCRLKRGAEEVCTHRNTSLPVELGKAVYELTSLGLTFSKAHFRLDSMHCDFFSVVVKVEYVEEENIWKVQIPNSESVDSQFQWVPYPFLPQSGDLTAVFREIEKDPKSYFWV